MRIKDVGTGEAGGTTFGTYMYRACTPALLSFASVSSVTVTADGACEGRGPGREGVSPEDSVGAMAAWSLEPRRGAQSFREGPSGAPLSEDFAQRPTGPPGQLPSGFEPSLPTVYTSFGHHVYQLVFLGADELSSLTSQCGS